MSEQERTPEEAAQELVSAWVAWKEDTEIGTADPSIARALIRKAAAPEQRPITSAPGAFFEVTGAEHELIRIVEGINRNDERLTSGSSMTIDLWQEMLEEWHTRRDARVRAEERAKRPDREQVKEVADALETLAEMITDGLSVNDLYAHLHEHQATLLSSIALEPEAREVTYAEVAAGGLGYNTERRRQGHMNAAVHSSSIRAALEASAQS